VLPMLRGCDNVMPPFQPVEDDDEELRVLRQCFGYPMLWPESQIRVGWEHHPTDIHGCPTR
jgi:hypothetical protein